jgi:hypothetical protein
MMEWLESLVQQRNSTSVSYKHKINGFTVFHKLLLITCGKLVDKAIVKIYY